MSGAGRESDCHWRPGQTEAQGEPDSQAEVTSVGSGTSLKSWLCHLLTETPWERSFMALCLSFPTCKTGYQLQTYSHITQFCG